jgi:chorismate-pyruvate lyase
VPAGLQKIIAMRIRCVAVALAPIAIAACAGVPPRGYVARVELLAQLQTLNADLLAHDSATLTLERWCGEHRLADPPRVIARRVRGAAKAIPDALRERLALGADERIAYRHVQLACGEHVLSEADNWYVPDRLTPEMNRRLDSSDEPFGKVVRALDFRRRTIAAELLFAPLPRGWEMAVPVAERALPEIPRYVLRHEAILYTPAQVPFSAVVETYTGETLRRMR